jgi:hypothetical protein
MALRHEGWEVCTASSGSAAGRAPMIHTRRGIGHVLKPAP